MGAINTKSEFERQNTIRKRNQRQTIHKIRTKAKSLINKSRQTNRNFTYYHNELQTLKTKLVRLEDRHPALDYIYNDTIALIDQHLDALKAKISPGEEPHVKEIRFSAVPVQEIEPKHDDDDDDDDEVEERAATSDDIQTKNRRSVMKLGVPVLPLSIIESRVLEVPSSVESKLDAFQARIEDLEEDIGGFSGVRGGAGYVKIKEALDEARRELEVVVPTSADAKLQIKRLLSFISNCMSFLEEQAKDPEEEMRNHDPMSKITKTTPI